MQDIVYIGGREEYQHGFIPYPPHSLDYPWTPLRPTALCSIVRSPPYPPPKKLCCYPTPPPI